MPPRKTGGHQHGNKATLVVTVEPDLRKKVERAADANHINLSRVVELALLRFFAKEDAG